MNAATDAGVQMLSETLLEQAAAVYGPGCTISGLQRLSGGASRETWSFLLQSADGSSRTLILKRDFVTYDATGAIRQTMPSNTFSTLSRLDEGRLMALAGEAGVPVPKLAFFLHAGPTTTDGFVTEYIAGEVLGRRILREQSLEQARAKLAFQCGAAAARLHSIDADKLPPLQSADAAATLAHCRDLLDASGHPYPVFEYAFAWLHERLALAGDGHSFVHGDFRNGNLIVAEGGLQGVLDFELGHLGNPASDLGWMCVPSWRFGHYRKPVGGFGELEELLDGYESAGGAAISRENVHYWQVFGSLRWGVICIGMGFAQIGSEQPALEPAAVGRRTAETEYDLLQMLD